MVGVRVTPDCDSINSVNISSANDVQMMPEVAFGNDNYMVVWSDARISNRIDIYGARVTPGGTVLDPDGILIGPGTETLQFEPSIAFTGTRFFVVWLNYSTEFGVAGRFVNCDGTLGDTVRIANTTNEGNRTSVAYDGTNFLVVWTQYIYFLMGQLVSGNGNLIGSPFTIATGVELSSSGSLSFDGNCYTVVYTIRNGNNYEVWGRQYDTSGNPLGPAFIISDPVNSSYDPHIVAGVTNYLNVWTHMEYPSDIYGNTDMLIGIDADESEVTAGATRLITSIIRGPLVFPGEEKYQVFDITGREVNANYLAPGIYFVEVDGEIVQKVIKVR